MYIFPGAVFQPQDDIFGDGIPFQQGVHFHCVIVKMKTITYQKMKTKLIVKQKTITGNNADSFSESIIIFQQEIIS